MIQHMTTMPERLARIKSPPKHLYIQSTDADRLDTLLLRRTIAIVGSRSASGYGAHVTADIAGKLAASGVVVVSGMAIGIDAIAHQAALDSGGETIAILPSSLEKVYPACHWQLASRIVQQRGALVSEYPAGTPSVRREYFIARNRLVSALADALVITEAAIDSGSLHTARFALQQGKPVFAVPGNITSPTSSGTNALLRRAEVRAVTSAEDILKALDGQDRIQAIAANLPKRRVVGDNQQQQRIIDLLEQGVRKTDALLAGTGMRIEDFNCHLGMLEISAKIRQIEGNSWTLV